VENKVLAALSLDHKPIMVRFETKDKTGWQRKRGFQFEESWVLEEDFQTVVGEVWRENTHAENKMQIVGAKLASYRLALQRWSKF
jgi:uncharacterized protein YcbX